MDAGAPKPTAFRAGNYAANADTLRALAELGFTHDSSHTPGFPDSPCELELDESHKQPLELRGITEVPIGCVGDPLQQLRHAQLTALSLRELVAATRHAVRADVESFTIVSHSFELLCRDREKINKVVKRRFDRFCEKLAGMRDARTGTFRKHPPQAQKNGAAMAVLPPSYLRTGERMVEQALANALYGRGWTRTG